MGLIGALCQAWRNEYSTTPWHTTMKGRIEDIEITWRRIKDKAVNRTEIFHMEVNVVLKQYKSETIAEYLVETLMASPATTTGRLPRERVSFTPISTWDGEEVLRDPTRRRFNDIHCNIASMLQIPKGELNG